MAEEAGDKTEPATPKRRQEAIDRGSRPKSQDLTAALLLLVGLMTLRYTGRQIQDGLAEIMRAFLGNHYDGPASDALPQAIRIAGPRVMGMLLPLFAALFTASAIVSVYQAGWNPNFARLQPKFAKLNPFGGIGRLFAARNGFAQLMNAGKLIIVLGVATQQFMHHWPAILALSGFGFPENMSLGCMIIYDMGWRITVALLILSLADYMYQMFKFERDIRMTKQEVKEEARSQEGDMESKGRRRAMARKMLMQRIQTDVPRADVVVTNPTELAIAIKYDPEKMNAPRVVAKGADYLAMRIRQIAVQSGVPIVERKPLAQALYKGVEIGQEVPPEFYKAIAEILAYVYELNGKMGRKKSRQEEPLELAGAERVENGV